MRDNSGNTTDPSGQLITFNRIDVSNNNPPLFNLFNNDENQDFDPLQEWREQTILNLLKILDENDRNGPQKRSRSTSPNNIIMNAPRPRSKKFRSSSLSDGMDDIIYPNTDLPDPSTINNRDSLNVYLSICDQQAPEDDEDPYAKCCDPSKSPIIIKEKINIEEEVNGLDDLIKLINNHPLVDNVEYNIDMVALHNIKPNLINLQSMIGMNSLKDHVVDQILYYLQGFHKMGESGDFMHTVIYGPPGTGKTEIAKIIGAIFAKLGVLNKKQFKKVTRADLIAGYLGQTALKTRDVIKEALGGVLFIDEAYALGNPEKKDSFAKECIDTLCDALSEHKDQLMVIIAGYEEELKKCFFSFNQGLDSRFTWRFKTDDYKADELMKIFEKKVNDAEWSIKDGSLGEEWFEKNMDYFKYYGRDIETLFAKVKIAHSRRVFCSKPEDKTVIVKKDLDNGLKLYLANDEVKERKDIKEREKMSMGVQYSMYS